MKPSYTFKNQDVIIFEAALISLCISWPFPLSVNHYFELYIILLIKKFIIYVSLPNILYNFAYFWTLKVYYTECNLKFLWILNFSDLSCFPYSCRSLFFPVRYGFFLGMYHCVSILLLLDCWCLSFFLSFLPFSPLSLPPTLLPFLPYLQTVILWTHGHFCTCVLVLGVGCAYVQL